MRWDYEVESELPEGESFKLNNNHVVYYVRMFLDDHPYMNGFFSVKKGKG